ncbi:FYVE zinc finger domain-containing protein [Dongshaea marina]|uniref:hypothetical protein n=1 Tax=Dongshaea marina TaxID=2047966 RepID=UPI00131EF42D|nr:hypothetical protein [Dongshaea marina]
MNVIIHFSGTGDDLKYRINEPAKSFRYRVDPDRQRDNTGKYRCQSCQKIVIKGTRHTCRACGIGFFCSTCTPKNPQFLNIRTCERCANKLQAKHEDEFGLSDLHYLMQRDQELLNADMESYKRQMTLNSVVSPSNNYYIQPKYLDDNTILLIINGCHKKDTGGKLSKATLTTFANLSVICNKIYDLFEGGRFPHNEAFLRHALGKAYGGVYTSNIEDPNISFFISHFDRLQANKAFFSPTNTHSIVDKIILTGYSRGLSPVSLWQRSSKGMQTPEIFLSLYLQINQFQGIILIMLRVLAVKNIMISLNVIILNSARCYWVITTKCHGIRSHFLSKWCPYVIKQRLVR